MAATAVDGHVVDTLAYPAEVQHVHDDADLRSNRSADDRSSQSGGGADHERAGPVGAYDGESSVHEDSDVHASGEEERRYSAEASSHGDHASQTSSQHASARGSVRSGSFHSEHHSELSQRSRDAPYDSEVSQGIKEVQPLDDENSSRHSSSSASGSEEVSIQDDEEADTSSVSTSSSSSESVTAESYSDSDVQKEDATAGSIRGDVYLPLSVRSVDVGNYAVTEGQQQQQQTVYGATTTTTYSGAVGGVATAGGVPGVTVRSWSEEPSRFYENAALNRQALTTSAVPRGVYSSTALPGGSTTTTTLGGIHGPATTSYNFSSSYPSAPSTFAATQNVMVGARNVSSYPSPISTTRGGAPTTTYTTMGGSTVSNSYKGIAGQSNTTLTQAPQSSPIFRSSSSPSGKPITRSVMSATPPATGGVYYQPTIVNSSSGPLTTSTNVHSVAAPLNSAMPTVMSTSRSINAVAAKGLAGATMMTPGQAQPMTTATVSTVHREVSVSQGPGVVSYISAQAAPPVTYQTVPSTSTAGNVALATAGRSLYQGVRTSPIPATAFMSGVPHAGYTSTVPMSTMPTIMTRDVVDVKPHRGKQISRTRKSKKSSASSTSSSYAGTITRSVHSARGSVAAPKRKRGICSC